MATRKVFRSGNSLVVSLPTEVLERLHLEEGTEVDIGMTSDREAMLLSRAEKDDVAINPLFAARVEEFIETYRPALEALSQR